MMPAETRPPTSEYATKADLAQLRQELKGDIRELRLELRGDIAELKADLARLMLTTLIAMTAIFGGLVTVLKLFG